MTRIPLVVIGGGPTGIAALVFARLRGIEAVGLEAGAQPLASVAGYMEQLTLVSPAWHYEVARIPLDCRDPSELCREDVLSYYARLIALARVELLCGRRCVALVARDDGVDVVCEGGERIEAEHALVTAWYEPRPVPPDLARIVEGGPRVLRSLARPSQAAGRRVAVIGGGMSAFEQSSAVMMLGQPVHVIARGPLAAFFHGERYRQLVAATGSTIVAGAAAITARAGGLAWRGPDGAPGTVDCDLVVACLGARLAPAIAGLLSDAGILSATTLEQIAAAPTVEELARTAGVRDHAEALDRALAARPDLWSLVFDGVSRVRLAGGGLHSGGAHAGVLASILTARLAIDAIAGRPPPADWAPPLPRAIVDHLPDRRPRPRFDRIAALRPLAITSWTRGTPRLLIEGPVGGLSEVEARERKYLLGPLVNNPQAALVLDEADGTRSIAELAAAAELDTDADRAALVSVLDALFRANALTWLPPDGGWP